MAPDSPSLHPKLATKAADKICGWNHSTRDEHFVQVAVAASYLFEEFYARMFFE